MEKRKQTMSAFLVFPLFQTVDTPAWMQFIVITDKVRKAVAHLSACPED